MIGDSFVSLDQFGEPIQFNVNRKPKVRTFFGTIVSIFLFALLIDYSYFKFNVLREREDTKYSMNTELNGLDINKQFTYEKTNLFFAVGVYPKSFGFFRGDIEDYLDIVAIVSPGRVNEIDQVANLTMRRCNEDDLKLFNKPIREEEQ